MILKLLAKDVKIFWKNIIIFILTCLILNDLMITLGEDSWRPYIFIGMIQISILIGYYAVFDKIRNGEILIGSLPITRNSIIRARYLSALSIALLGVFLWLINALILESTAINTPGDFDPNFGPYSFFFVSAYLVIFISIFIPVTIKYSKLWALVALIYMGAVVFIFSIKVLHHIFYQYVFGSARVTFGFSTIFMLILFGCLLASVTISAKIYKTIDL
ncbi:ABC-2 transporter permease [candidate division KSB1 bacterium]|nr:ABC-2 transporter permease [candidate division KSB1 bacterium]